MSISILSSTTISGFGAGDASWCGLFNRAVKLGVFRPAQDRGALTTGESAGDREVGEGHAADLGSLLLGGDEPGQPVDDVGGEDSPLLLGELAVHQARPASTPLRSRAFM